MTLVPLIAERSHCPHVCSSRPSPQCGQGAHDCPSRAENQGQSMPSLTIFYNYCM